MWMQSWNGNLEIWLIVRFLVDFFFGGNLLILTGIILKHNYVEK